MAKIGTGTSWHDILRTKGEIVPNVICLGLDFEITTSFFSDNVLIEFRLHISFASRSGLGKVLVCCAGIWVWSSCKACSLH